MMIRMLPQMKRIIFAADELLSESTTGPTHTPSYIASEYPNIEYERPVGKERKNKQLQEYLLTDDPTTSILFSTRFYERKNLFDRLHSSAVIFS